MNIFETLRDQVPLEVVLGVKTGEKTHCVALGHEDTNPSLHNYGDHAHCFTCPFHDDVTGVWAAMGGFSRPVEAALDLARKFGIELPEVDPEARQKAQERRDKEDQYLRQARACHRALESRPRTREWWEGRGFDRELQERFMLGTTRDDTTAVIPFWHRGRVHGLIRRPLNEKPRKYLYPKTEEFAAGYRPLFIPGSLRGDAFLVEGIVDALALAALGESAIAVGGKDISESHMRDLMKLPGQFYILPDADEPGERAARQWACALYPKALLCPADYGEEAHDA
jgi:DNA primase